MPPLSISRHNGRHLNQAEDVRLKTYAGSPKAKLAEQLLKVGAQKMPPRFAQRFASPTRASWRVQAYRFPDRSILVFWEHAHIIQAVLLPRLNNCQD
jgi:hypothetical protein